MKISRDGFALKIILSYLVLALLGGALAYLLYLEVNSYLGSTESRENDTKLVRTSALVSSVYEAENLSKMALQDPAPERFIAYDNKLDSIYSALERLKDITGDTLQREFLDSIAYLLNRKSENTYRLRELKMRATGENSFDQALQYFSRLEADMGKITPGALAPNLDELPVKAQQVIRDIAEYLNNNIPEDRDSIDVRQVDSVLQQARATLLRARDADRKKQRSLANQERTITANDMHLSDQLRAIINAVEQEMMKKRLASSLEKEALLQKGRRLTWIAALGGLFLVLLFTFLISRDFWKVQAYRKSLEREKRYSESLLQSREQLINTVSHDLRTPLQTIRGYGELLETRQLPRKEKKWVKNILSASFYVEKLVNDLLDFSRLEAGKLNLETNPFSLPGLLGHLSKEIAAQYPDKSELYLAVKIDDELRRPILGDVIRVRQILSNLLTNAYKFTERGGITLSAAIEADSVAISVADTGMGIPKEEQHKIFQEFTQAKGTAHGKQLGYGLGLTISKKLAELLGGRLELDSSPGSGSKFTLYLPLTFAAEPQPGLQENTNQIRHVLIVDDDMAMRNLLKVQCAELGVTASTFGSAASLPRNGDLQYDLLLTDIQMPGMDGFELLGKLRSGAYEHYSGQPVVAMTGRKDVDRDVYLEAGFLRVVAKPFGREMLAELLGVSAPKTEQRELKEAPDLAAIISFVGDEETALDIVLTYLRESRSLLTSMEQALEQDKLRALGAAAHRMLPMARQLGLKELITILAPLEPLSERPSGMTREEIRSRLQKLEQELDRLEQLFKGRVYSD